MRVQTAFASLLRGATLTGSTEWTDEEVAVLQSGKHETGLIFPDATSLYSVDAQILQYKQQ